MHHQAISPKQRSMNHSATAFSQRRGWQLTNRVLAAIAGGYLFCWGVVSLGVASAVALGAPYEQAHQLAMLLVFLLYLLVFCWVFAARSLWHIWLLLAGGGGLMTAAATLLARHLA